MPLNVDDIKIEIKEVFEAEMNETTNPAACLDRIATGLANILVTAIEEAIREANN